MVRYIFCNLKRENSEKKSDNQASSERINQMVPAVVRSLLWSRLAQALATFDILLLSY